MDPKWKTVLVTLMNENELSRKVVFSPWSVHLDCLV